MKRSFHITFFLLLSCFVQAQSIDFKWDSVHNNKVYKDIPMNPRPKLLYYNSTGFLFINQWSDGIYGASTTLIQRYNAQRELVASNEIVQRNQDGDKCDYVTALYTGDSIIILMKRSGLSKRYLYAFMVSVDGKPGRCVTLDTLVSPLNDYNYKIVTLQGQNRFLVCAKSPDRWNLFPKATLHMKMFDMQLRKEWSIHKELPYSGADFPLNHFAMTETGSAYAVGVIDGAYKLLAYDPTTQKLVRKDMGMGGAGNISGFNLHYEKGNLYAVGLYGDKKEKEGLCLQVINTTNMETTLETQARFDVKSLRNILGEKQVGKGRKIPDTYIIHHIIPCDDGGVAVAFENTYSITNVSNGNYSYVHHKGNVVVSKISTGGTIQWNHVIWKDYHYGGYLETEHGYALSAYQGTIYILHEDMEKNRKIDPATENIQDYNPNKGLLTLATINKDGVIKRNDMGPMIDPNDKTLIDLSSYRQIDNDHAMIYASRKKYRKIGIVTIKP